MTKAEIVQTLYTKVGGFSKRESADILDAIFEILKQTLGRGEKVKISGFGNFVLRDKRQRPGRNPQTGVPIKISERRVLTFKASQILKQALNQRGVVPIQAGQAGEAPVFAPAGGGPPGLAPAGGGPPGLAPASGGPPGLAESGEIAPGHLGAKP